MRNNRHHAVYCIISKVLETNGKYSSIVVISVPRAFRSMPETASITAVTILAIHVTIPSKIQSRIIITSESIKKDRHGYDGG
ncbi:MAG: hypothetical protein FWD71_23330 [Oscillospiraceae bacterium]|nr:hypothetical protein [Oscillospiraceae bacterium]